MLFEFLDGETPAFGVDRNLPLCMRKAVVAHDKEQWKDSPEFVAGAFRVPICPRLLVHFLLFHALPVLVYPYLPVPTVISSHNPPRRNTTH